MQQDCRTRKEREVQQNRSPISFQQQQQQHIDTTNVIVILYD
jgi:uncharacterized phage-like protein YoqJ